MKEKILKIIGMILLLIVLALSLPFAVPRLMGYQLFEVTSQSMKPDIPKGSLIFVKSIDSDEVFEDDVITFYADGSKSKVVTHRVMEVNEEEEYFVTKGDANETEDADSVAYDQLIGKVAFTIPNGAAVAGFVYSMAGKVVLGIMIIIVLACWICSDIICKKSQNSKGRGFGSYILVTIGIILVVFSGYNLFKIFSDYKTSDDSYAKIQDEYVSEAKDDTQKEQNWYDEISVDFASLKSQNEDVIGWIYFENEDISYPIMYSGDDNYYLRKTFDRQAATAGSIFLEGQNNTDFNDAHSIIYGHNMKNLSMFGKLKYYNRDDTYYDGHQYFQILVDGKKYRYQIFSYETVDDTSDEYTVGFAHDDTFGEFVSKMTASSMKDTGITPTKDDKIVTLSTCSTSGDTYRFVVHGVRVDEHDD